MTSEQSQKRPNIKIAKPYNDEAIERSVISILKSGMLVQGAKVKEFEAALTQYIGCRNVVAVNSGTAALHLALYSIADPKRKNAEAITSPLSFAATANAALASGLTPVFADVDPETFNIDPDNVEEKVSEKTIAIEPVDVYGLPADLGKLGQIAKRHNLKVVEDSAEAIGASYNGKKIGNISDLSCFSTYATKNLHTGEGGFVTTNDDAVAERIRMERNQGQASRYNQKTFGYNFRMLEICAAIGIEQLKILDELNEKRRSNAAALMSGLEDIESLGFQRVDDTKNHAWYMFALTLDEKTAGLSRDKLVQKLREEGVEADVSWPTPIHLQPYYQEKFGFKEGDYPIAETVCKTVFQLPIQPFLTPEEVDRTISTMHEVLQN
ncbi:MAG: DegT/DnrJ/EryC1/StrS family aminotransferase [Thaumarchaeota archaeon]|nr:DegT/DnrJ/EryC1/StrS family aminotransferase [Nitrososphaerota archaeon]